MLNVYTELLRFLHPKVKHLMWAAYQLWLLWLQLLDASPGGSESPLVLSAGPLRFWMIVFCRVFSPEQLSPAQFPAHRSRHQFKRTSKKSCKTAPTSTLSLCERQYGKSVFTSADSCSLVSFLSFSSPDKFQNVNQHSNT